MPRMRLAILLLCLLLAACREYPPLSEGGASCRDPLHPRHSASVGGATFTLWRVERDGNRLTAHLAIRYAGPDASLPVRADQFSMSSLRGIAYTPLAFDAPAVSRGGETVYLIPFEVEAYDELLCLAVRVTEPPVFVAVY